MNIAHNVSPVPASRMNLASLGRFLMVALGVAMLSLFLSPVATAGVNGKYKYISASGSFSIAGQSVKISRNDMKAVMTNSAGYTVIKNGKIRFNAEDSDKLIKKSLKDAGLDLKISVSGPKTLKLRKSGKTYVGSGNKPVVVKIKGEVQGQSINGKLKYKFNPKVKGDKLTLNVPVSGSMMGFPIKGTVKIVCKR